MSCHACRQSSRQNRLPEGCTQVETLSCGSTAPRRAAEASWLSKQVARACRQWIEAAMGAGGVERARVEANRRARGKAGTAREPQSGVFEDLRVGEPTTGEEDANEVGAGGGTERVTRGGGSITPGVDEARPEASPVRRRALRFRRSRMRCRHSGQSSVPSSHTVPRRRPEALTSTSGI